MSCRHVCSQHTPTTDYLFRYSFTDWSNGNPSIASTSLSKQKTMNFMISENCKHAAVMCGRQKCAHLLNNSVVFLLRLISSSLSQVLTCASFSIALEPRFALTPVQALSVFTCCVWWAWRRWWCTLVDICETKKSSEPFKRFFTRVFANLSFIVEVQYN